MKVLDELERLQIHVSSNNKPNQIHIHPAHVGLGDALPALIRVARAAEAYNVSRGAKAGRELEEALQQLRNLHAAELAALQQEMGLDD